MNRIVLYGHGGSMNHGCEAIVRSTVEILSNNDVNEPITLGTYAKNEDQKYNLDQVIDSLVEHKKIKRYSLTHLKKAVLNRLFRDNFRNKRFSAITRFFDKERQYINEEIISSIDKSTIALSIGGDNYCYGYPNNWMYINNASKQKQAITVLWGCSIEPDILRHSEVIEDMKRYDLITPRESITFEALIQSGVIENTHLLPDPAFTLKKTQLQLPEGFIENNTVGINMSPLIMSREKKNNITHYNYFNLIQFIVETTDMKIALIPHVTWEHNNDLEPLTTLYEQFKDTGRVCLIDEQYNCMELKGFISRCRFFVGARTHATIAAYSTCVPTLVVGYSVKARGIARDIFGSEENMVIPVQSLQHEDDLVNAFKYIQDNEDNIRRHLQEFMPSYIEKAWQAGEEVRKLIEK